MSTSSSSIEQQKLNIESWRVLALSPQEKQKLLLQQEKLSQSQSCAPNCLDNLVCLASVAMASSQNVELTGKRVRVYWEGDKKHFNGHIIDTCNYTRVKVRSEKSIGKMITKNGMMLSLSPANNCAQEAAFAANIQDT